jgi:hypothetical protein
VIANGSQPWFGTAIVVGGVLFGVRLPVTGCCVIVDESVVTTRSLVRTRRFPMTTLINAQPCGTERCQARVPGATAKGWDDLSVSRFERSSVIEHEDVRRQESRCVDQRSNRRHAGSLGRVLGGQSTRATLVFRSDLSTLYRELGVSSDTTAKAGGNEKLRVRGLLILDE